MSKYINEQHEKDTNGQIIKEYKHKTIIYRSSRTGRYLSVDGKKLQQHTKTSITELERLRKKMKN